MPTNLIRIPSDDETSFSLFKDSFLDSMNKVLLSVDSTLSTFPRQKKIINLNDKTFVKTVNVLYTDEDIYNLSYVRMIKRNTTGNEPYKFKFFKIDSATIAQNKLTPEANAILKTPDASNVFMIITISYAQEFLNILSSNYIYCTQMMFLCDAFVSSKLVVKNQLLYAYTMVNENSPRSIDYFQRLLFNGPGYINYYTVSILCFLKLHTELINNNILNDLTTTDMIKILSRGNEYINGQPINTKKSVISVPFESLSQKANPKKKKRMGCRIQINTQRNGQYAPVFSALNAGKEVTSEESTNSVVKVKDILTYKIKDLIASKQIKEFIMGLQYIVNNQPYIPEYEYATTYIKDCLIYTDEDINNNEDINEFLNKDLTVGEINIWVFCVYSCLTYYDNEVLTYGYIPEIVINGKTLDWDTFYEKYTTILFSILYELPY